MAAKWSLSDRIQRRWFIHYYVRRKIRHTEQANKKKLAEARSLSADDQWNLRNRLNHDLWELSEWQKSITDKDLVRRAQRIDVDLDAIPIPEPEPHQNRGFWKMNEMGDEVLYDEVRKSLRKAVRERDAIYRKERRDAFDVYVLRFGSFLLALLSVLFAIITTIKR